MRKFNLIVVALLAASAAAFTGCSDSSSSVAEDSAPKESKPAVAVSESRLGERLKKVAAIYEGGKYTLECTLSGSQFDEAIAITQVADGEDFYQLQTEKLGSHGVVSISGKGYEFDYVCGMYRENVEIPRFNIVTQLAAENIAPDQAPWLSDDNYDIERYTYAGSTYITVTDFYFDKQSGDLVKYISTYTAEGKPEIVETRTVTKLEAEADSSVFNAYFADELQDFDSMSSERKLGFCQGICGSWGITTEDLFNAGITADSFGDMDYDTLFRLVYKYGKPHDAAAPALPEEPEEDSSSLDESSADEGAESSSQDEESSEDEAASDEESSEEVSSEEETSSTEDSDGSGDGSDDTQSEE